MGTVLDIHYLTMPPGAGTWPDNEPAVSCLDWQTGQPNVRYFWSLVDHLEMKLNKRARDEF